MTLIECFDRSVIENIVGCLHLRPEKLIFLGDEQQMCQSVQRYRAFLAARGMDTTIQLYHVRMDKMETIAAALSNIVQNEKQCVIDVTGGDERVLMAVGAMLAQLDERQRRTVSVQKFDLQSGTAQDCDNDGNVVLGNPAKLTVQELVCLHGGIIHPSSAQPAHHYTPRDLQPLWEVASLDSKVWNRRLSSLIEFESRAHSKTQVFLPLNRIQNGIKRFDEKCTEVIALLHEFHKRGIVQGLQCRTNSLSYTYTNDLMRWCTLKAGNILETKTLLEARALEENGKPYFDDCQMGVHIDWDGIVHPSKNRTPETRNEIDLVLTHGLTPLFISCKSGDIGEEELYKLHTVASRFGGPSVRKLLITPHLEQSKPRSDRAFIQRARDMGIYLVPDAADLSNEEWQQIFISAMQ